MKPGISYRNDIGDQFILHLFGSGWYHNIFGEAWQIHIGVNLFLKCDLFRSLIFEYSKALNNAALNSAILD